MFIDKAMNDASILKKPEAWYLKGFIYKELYKKYQSTNATSAFRDTAIADLFISSHLDSSKDNRDNTYSTIKYLAATYYNDAAANMDSAHYLVGIRAYRRYRIIMQKIAPQTDFNAQDADFHVAVGDIYSSLFFNTLLTGIQVKYLDSAKEAFNATLAIAPNNYEANYGLGRLYYNQAVNIMNNIPFDAPLSALDKAQDTCVYLAKEALPYMQKAHTISPDKLEPVKGLEGIYYLLHDTQKFQEFQAIEKTLKE